MAFSKAAVVKCSVSFMVSLMLGHIKALYAGCRSAVSAIIIATKSFIAHASGVSLTWLGLTVIALIQSI